MTAGVAERALRIIGGNRYAVIATATPDGEPWATPVYFVNRGLTTLLWLSRPGTHHSQLITENDRLAVTVFDSTVRFGEAEAFYARATAGLCPEGELADQLEAFSDRSRELGFPAWRLDQVTGEAPLRLYLARVSEAWLLPADDGPERRIPIVPLEP